jgi:SPP1 family predicted phage head-tail adaptor
VSVASMSNKTATVQRKTETKDAFGGLTESWSKSSTIQLNLQPISGRQANDYDREEYEVTHKGFTSGTPDVAPNDRLSIDGNVYIIRAVLNVISMNVLTTILLEREI